jgi:hypothetical protein
MIFDKMLNKFYWYCMVFISVFYLPVISLLSSKPRFHIVNTFQFDLCVYTR